ncbi:MAG: hypothetical protein R3E91_05340 [Chlamydiales bacterium]
MALSVHNTFTNKPRSSVKSMSKPGYLLIALGVIALIGSLVAAGCLYAQLGSLSFSIGGAGMIICILNSVLSKYCCLKKTNRHSSLNKTKDAKKRIRDKPPMQNNGNISPPLPPTIPQHQAHQQENISAKKNEPFALDLKKLYPTSEEELESFTDDELKKIVASSLLWLNNEKVWNIIGQRLKTIENNKQLVGLDNTLLVDLKYLTANDINTNPKKFPPITFLLIDINELKKIQIQKLDDQQLQLIFSATDQSNTDYFIQRLTHDQITQCINKTKYTSSLKKLLFMNLSEEQVLNLDFSKIDKDIFNLIFSLDESQRFNANVLLPKFKVDKIYDLIPYFSKEHFEHISDEQVKNMDFSHLRKIRNKQDYSALADNKEKMKAIVNILFSTENGQNSKAAKRIPTLSTENIDALMPYSSIEQWKYIHDDQIDKIDLSKWMRSLLITVLKDEQEIREMVNILFSTENGQNSKAAKWMPKISNAIIENLIPYFSNEHFEYISDEQVKNMSFSNILKGLTKAKYGDKERKEMVNTLFSTQGDTESRAAKRIPQLSCFNIYKLIPYFSNEHFEHISDEQVENMNFPELIEQLKTAGYTEEQIRPIVNILFSTAGGNESKAAKYISGASSRHIMVLFSYLSNEQLECCIPTILDVDKLLELVNNYFDKTHYQYISNAQANMVLNFQKVKKEKQREVFDELFSTVGGDESKAAKRMSKIVHIKTVLPYCSYEHLKHIADWQAIDVIKHLDFSKMNPDQQAFFDDFFSTAGDDKSKAAERISIILDKNKMDLFLPYFSEKHFEYIKDYQLRYIDFSKIQEGKRKAACNTLWSIEGGNDSKAKKHYFNFKANVIQELLPYFSDEQSKYLIPRIATEEISELSSNFSTEHFKYMTNYQASHIDFSKIQKDKQKECFNNLYPIVENEGLNKDTKIRIAQFSTENIHQIVLCFSNKHWEYITDEQAQNIEFSKILKELKIANYTELQKQQILSIVFSTQGGEQSKAAKRIPHLGACNIGKFVRYFSKEQWEYWIPKLLNNFQDMIYFLEYLTDEQWKSLRPNIEMKDIPSLLCWCTEKQWESLVPMLKDKVKEIISDLGKDRWKSLIPEIPAKHIHIFIPYFSSKDWDSITNQQACTQGFFKTAIEIIKESVQGSDSPEQLSQIKKILNTLLSTRFNTASKAAQRIPQLSIEDIFAFTPYSIKEYWEYVSDEQVCTEGFLANVIGILKEAEYTEEDIEQLVSILFSNKKEGGNTSKFDRRIKQLKNEDLKRFKNFTKQ